MRPKSKQDFSPVRDKNPARPKTVQATRSKKVEKADAGTAK